MTSISIVAGELVYSNNRNYASDGIPLSFLLNGVSQFGWARIEGEKVILDNKISFPEETVKKLED